MSSIKNIFSSISEMNTFSCKNMAKDFIYKVKIFKNLPQNKEESMKQDSIVLPSLNFKNNNGIIYFVLHLCILKKDDLLI